MYSRMPRLLLAVLIQLRGKKGSTVEVKYLLMFSFFHQINYAEANCSINFNDYSSFGEFNGYFSRFLITDFLQLCGNDRKSLRDSIFLTRFCFQIL